MRALWVLGVWLGFAATLIGSFLFFGWLGQRFLYTAARFLERSRRG